ncbi:TRAP transporter small permease [Alkalihalobacterium elongatum]|uniref:TRAP transporter small permease n=1 Tax=Alkalihalobacterium elongatum TaxID=2675466 RepID=UPI001C1FF9DE|nr:TRAP transporter small permease subunit [Alkalihalobacterium elongatum]
MDKLQKIDSSTRFLDKGLEITAIVCLIISVAGAVISVFSRYLLGMSFQVIEEICRYAIIYGAFAYIGPLVKRKEHLKMDILQGLLKNKVKKSNELLISVILFASFGFLCLSSIMWTISLLNMQVKTASGIMLMFIPALAIPIGMLLGCIYSFLQILQNFYKLRQPENEKIEDVSSIESEVGS